jgi:hypothetical protein
MAPRRDPWQTLDTLQGAILDVQWNPRVTRS